MKMRKSIFKGGQIHTKQGVKIDVKHNIQLIKH